MIYNRRPEVHAVVHAHPPTATAHAAAGIPLNKALLSELIIALGCIPVAQYGTPGTQELSDALEPMVQHYDAILLANHGVVTCGPDLLTAFFRMETVEHFAQVSLMTELLGKQVLLSGRDVEKLLVARARYGTTTASTVIPGCPVTSDRRGWRTTAGTHFGDARRAGSIDRRSSAQGPRACDKRAKRQLNFRPSEFSASAPAGFFDGRPRRKKHGRSTRHDRDPRPGRDD